MYCRFGGAGLLGKGGSGVLYKIWNLRSWSLHRGWYCTVLVTPEMFYICTSTVLVLVLYSTENPPPPPPHPRDQLLSRILSDLQ